MAEFSTRHAFSLLHADIRYYLRKRRNVRSFLRAQWMTWARRYPWELCQECGRPNAYEPPFAWRADDAMWRKLVNADGSGLMCPSCFNQLAAAHGIRLYWRAEVMP
jgi:hypothetical protein